jgi:hypothetical protein
MNTTKRYVYFILALISAAVLAGSASGAAGGDWGDITNNVQICLALKGKQREIKPKEPVTVLVRFRNLSTNRTIGVFETGAPEYDDTYSWSVISPSGKNISPDFKTIPTCDNGHTLWIPPAHTEQVELNLLPSHRNLKKTVGNLQKTCHTAGE